MLYSGVFVFRCQPLALEVGHHEPLLSLTLKVLKLRGHLYSHSPFPLFLCFLCSVSIKFGKLITNTTLLVCSARLPWFVELVRVPSGTEEEDGMIKYAGI